MNTALAQQQTALLDLLHVNAIDSIALSADLMRANSHFHLKNTTSVARGLRAYRANAQELSVKVLHTSHPVLQQLLGEENFSHLAQDFWQAMPPKRGDLAQWGGDLAAYLLQVPQLQALLHEHAYLPDVARVEWALHEAATACDAALDAQSFEWLTSRDPVDLHLDFSPGCTVLRCTHPVVSIMQLHDERMSDLHETAREAIAQGEPQTALIWRQGFRPMLADLDAAPAALIEATLQGQSLAAAVDAALAQTSDFDFSAWLAASVQSGLLVGIVQQAQAEGSSL